MEEAEECERDRGLLAHRASGAVVNLDSEDSIEVGQRSSLG
jgi:hypothetical protein